VKSDLLEILCCPLCRGTLTLRSDRTDGDEIVQGALTCAHCQVEYPIADGIPDLLPPNERD
jgi:uncharacterized protein